MNQEKQIDKLISTLNDRQQEAVLAREKHVRVLAGAGSGKTKVLTTRMAYLALIGAEPDSILAVTFTNKAANEMKERAMKMLPKELNIDANKMWIGTFHGLCNRIISAHHNLLNLPKNSIELASNQGLYNLNLLYKQKQNIINSNYNVSLINFPGSIKLYHSVFNNKLSFSILDYGNFEIK